jgi:hypothetical protein
MADPAFDREVRFVMAGKSTGSIEKQIPVAVAIATASGTRILD